MIQRVRLSIFVLAFFAWIILFFALSVQAQQTLGGITGTVTDSSAASRGRADNTVGDKTPSRAL